MPTYERITYRPPGATRARTAILRDPADREVVLAGTTVRFVVGAEVSRTEEDLGRVHMIGADVIEKRLPLRLDRHYGELVPIS